MAPIDLDALQALADAATPGPWEVDCCSIRSVANVVEYGRLETLADALSPGWENLPDGQYPAEAASLLMAMDGIRLDVALCRGGDITRADQTFIAAARAAVPALIAMVRTERAAVVAWLRSYAAALPQHKQAAASGIADAIARGEHVTTAAQTH